MGAFWQVALLPGKKSDGIQEMLVEIAADCPSMQLQPEECCIHNFNKGVGILFNDHVAGYDKLARKLSEKTSSAVLLLYIYDDDYWGYFFWENGRELDCFSPVPEYFDEEPKEEETYFGNPEIIAAYFNVKQESIENYYRRWYASDAESREAKSKKRELADHNETAYLEDECSYGDCWQIADFMEKLGFLWEDFDGKNIKICEEETSAPQYIVPEFVRVSMRPAGLCEAWFRVASTLERLPGIFEVAYIWNLLKNYSEELFLLFDYERYDEASKILTGMIKAHPQNAELYILRAFCCLSHPAVPRRENRKEQLFREEQAKEDLDLAFLYEPNNIRLLRMHCQPEECLRHWSKNPKVSDIRKIAFLEQLIKLDTKYIPGYKLAQAYCYENLGDIAQARKLLYKLIHAKLPETVDFALSFEEIFKRLEPGKDLKEELERDYKRYIKEFLKDNPKLKFRQAELCWNYKRAAAMEMVCYEKEDLKLLAAKSCEAKFLNKK